MLDLSSDLQVLAATIYGEARGEPEEGRIAVACVVLNRVATSRMTHRRQFGDGTIRGACLAPYQFSCWNRGDPNRAKLLALDAGIATFDAYRRLAMEALGGALADPTHGATHYKVSTLAWPEDWGPEQPLPLAIIGRHSFYRLP